MTSISSATYASPIGALTLVAGEPGLRALRFPGRELPEPHLPGHGLHEPRFTGGDPRARDDHPLPEALAVAVQQLEDYFAGERRGFELELDLAGTPFQLSVWATLARIPYGTTTTYGAIARELGRQRGGPAPEPRGVGSAVASTPVPIVIPCHRVVGADGSLTGYGGGLPRKRALLDFEASGGRPSALLASWAERQLTLL